MDTLRRLIQAVLSLVALAAGIIGLPLALLQWGHWPITGIPTWEQVSDLPYTIVTDTAIFGVLTVAAWAVWAAFTASVVMELVANTRRATSRDLPLCAPVQRMVRPLVAALVMSASTSSLSGTPVGAMPFGDRPPVTVVVDQPAEPGDPSSGAGEPAPRDLVPGGDEASGRTVMVQVNDTYWEVAERELGDGLRWREVRDLNTGRVMPDGHRIDPGSDLLAPGWVLRLPGDSEAGSPSTATEPVGQEVVVQSGDSMWSLAEDRLADVSGHAPDEGETAAYWGRVVAANGDRFVDAGNPDLILPGQTLLLPDVASPTSPSPVGQPATSAPVAPEPQAPPTSDPTTSTTGRASPPAPAGSPPSATTSPAPPAPDRSSAPASTTTPAASEGTAPSTSPEPPQPSPTDTAAASELEEMDDEDEGVPIVAAAVASTALAVGVTAAIRLRRRRRNHFAPTRLPTPPADEAFHQELIVAADEDSIEALRGALGLLAAGLSESGQPCRPVVVLHGAGYTDVLLDQPAMPPVEGWEAVSNGEIWALDAPAVRVGGPGRWASPAPLLVSLGRPDDGGQLYLDLEAAGLTSLTGDPVARLDLLRAFATEVAHSPVGEEATRVVVIGDFGIEALFEESQQVTVVDGWDAVLDDLVAWTEQSRAALSHQGHHNPFVARTGDLEDDSLLSLLVLATMPPPPPETLDFLRSRGPATTAVLVADDQPLPGSTIVECSPGELRVPQYDLTCVPEGLDPETFARIIDLLREASDPAGTEIDHTIIPTHHNGDGNDDAGEDEYQDQLPEAPYSDPPYDVLIRCLGEVSVEGDFKRRLRQQEVAALAYVALNGPVAIDRVQDALWAGSTNDNRRRRLITMMSVCRDVIGLRHLPHAEDGRYTVGPAVKTDTELFESRVLAATSRRDPAEAADLFLDALSLCTGPVFHTQQVDEVSFAWIEASNLVSHWVIRITDLATDLAQDRLAHGDTRRAIKACEAGLRAMPTHVGCTEALMRAHADNGDRAAIQHVYQAHVTALDLIHLDQPAESTRALYNQLMDEA